MSLLIKTQNLCIDRIAQPRCALSDCVKQMLKIACHCGDHPQDVIGGVLALQRFGQFSPHLGNRLRFLRYRRCHYRTARFYFSALRAFFSGVWHKQKSETEIWIGEKTTWRRSGCAAATAPLRLKLSFTSGGWWRQTKKCQFAHSQQQDAKHFSSKL
jgi:hypothetical protein